MVSRSTLISKLPRSPSFDSTLIQVPHLICFRVPLVLWLQRSWVRFSPSLSSFFFVKRISLFLVFFCTYANSVHTVGLTYPSFRRLGCSFQSFTVLNRTWRGGSLICAILAVLILSENTSSAVGYKHCRFYHSPFRFSFSPSCFLSGKCLLP